MSCPDWRTATAWRSDEGAAARDWPANLEHLEGCPLCRQRVAEIDPTLLLAAAAAPTPAMGEGDVRRLTDTVRAMVAAERLAAHSRPDRRALLAVAALVILFATPLGLSRLVGRAGGPVVAPEAATRLLEPVDEPPIEEVQPAAARVYQFGTEELPVVLIFDENLDL